MFRSVWLRSTVRRSAVVLLVSLLCTACESVQGTGLARTAKLPVPECPGTTLWLDGGWSFAEERYSLSTSDRQLLDAWVLAWIDCAAKRRAVIEEANR